MSYRPDNVKSYEVLETTTTSHGVERRCLIDYESGEREYRWLRPTTFDDLEKYKIVYRIH